jgi:PAS domain S-box-containing protein
MKDKPVILVVDDQPQNIELLEAHLAPHGYEIVTAANGEEALGKLSGNQIDLILLDVMMPGMDGFEVTRRVRQDNAHRLLPIILVTVLRESEDRVKGIEAGCDDFLSTPYDKLELLARVQSLLKVKDYNDLMSNYQKDLESEVTGRTEELKHALENLQQEITEHKRAEEALRKSEKYFKEITENSSDIIIITDKNGDIKYCSRSIERIAGYRPVELIGRSSLTLIHPDDKKRAIGDFGKAILAIDYTIPNAFRILHKDGSERYFEGLGKNFLDNPSVAGFIMNVHDMTERKQAEDALRESEEKYRLIAENTADLIVVTDMNLRFTYISPSIMRTHGFTVEEAMNMTLDQLLTPESLQNLLTVFEEEMKLEATGTADPKRISRLEVEGYKKDGSIIWMEISVSNQRDKENKPIGILAVNRDITERKMAEKELKQTLESLRKAVGATIQTMVSAVEMRDPYTAGHQLRTANLACAIATEIGLPQEKIDGIRMAGSIHDIGKLSVPAEILSKPTKLTNIEFSLIKEHSRKGYEMLKDVESSWPLAQIVYQHHERMDGSGYPRNLKGDEILMEARIMAVADVVEAMASHRPYRPALGLDMALAEIQKNKGTHYDNTVVDACLRLFREKGYQLELT